MAPARPHLLSQLVTHAAERDADAPAVRCGDDALSYGELADRIGRTARALVDNGVKPNDRVVISAPKSVDTFVAMHAAMHAGAIAAPVNPKTAPSMLATAVAELAPTAAVLSRQVAARWPDTHPVVSIGAQATPDSVLVDGEHIAALEPRSLVDRTGSDPAYLITTSGSTGRPKSIVHTHGSGLRYAELSADCYGLDSTDRMGNIAPFHFDQSTFELYAGPLVGATVVLVPDALLSFPADVSALIERERLTVWYSVPTILRHLLERGALHERDTSSLRWVLFGGEVFPSAQLRKVMQLCSGARFSNVYGPAEVNQCMFHHIDEPPGDDAPIPIGRGWQDTELRIVDTHGEPVEGACRGELEVRSSTAMAGYWGQPDLTAAAFAVVEGAGGLTHRWYRTGDLVERDHHGVLQFLGRIDRQVKVRGIRIELEAIEAALGAVPGVTGCAAVVTDDGESPLVGVVESDTLSDAADVHRALRGVLSPDTTPDRIVIAEALPRTTSGKIDVKATAQLVTSGALT